MLYLNYVSKTILKLFWSDFFIIIIWDTIFTQIYAFKDTFVYHFTLKKNKKQTNPLINSVQHSQQNNV